jgi:hypothetical protein
MEWNRSNAIGLALASCTLCEGHGIISVRGDAERPCDCVFRAIFRACYRRFRDCAMRGTQFGTVSLECTHGPVGKHFYSRKREEFAADFCLVTRRVLTEAEYKIFRYTFLLGADWKMCADHLGLDRGNFYHAIYRIEEKLGREYADLKPYPLYPVDEYFGSQIRHSTPRDPAPRGAQGARADGPAAARHRRAAPLRRSGRADERRLMRAEWWPRPHSGAAAARRMRASSARYGQSMRRQFACLLLATGLAGTAASIFNPHYSLARQSHD